MRRRILENRTVPIPDLPATAPREAKKEDKPAARRAPAARRPKTKGRVPRAEPTPSLLAGKSGRH